MGMYPIMIDLQGRAALVVGGGGIAERKIRGLLEARACVTVVTESMSEGIQELERNGSLVLKRKPFSPDDIGENVVIIAATDSPEVNEHVFRCGDEAGKLVNSVDDKKNCSFIVPASVRRGNLTVSISTGGAAPYFARRLREFLENLFPDGLADDLCKLKIVRDEVMAETELVQTERMTYCFEL